MILRSRSGAVRTDFSARIQAHFIENVWPMVIRHAFRKRSFEHLTWRDHPLTKMVRKRR